MVSAEDRDREEAEASKRAANVAAAEAASRLEEDKKQIAKTLGNAALAVYVDPPARLLVDMDYNLTRARFMFYLSQSHDFSKSLHAETAVKNYHSVGAEFKMLSRMRSDLESGVRKYVDLVALFDFEGKHVFQEYTALLIELGGKVTKVPAAGEAQAHPPVKDAPETKHLVYQELLRDVKMLPLTGPPKRLQPFHSLPTVRVMHPPLPIPDDPNTDLEAAIASATRTHGNLIHDLACKVKDKNLASKDIEYTPLPNKWPKLCSRTTERSRLPPFAANPAFNADEQERMAEYKDDLRDNYNVVTAYHSEYADKTKGKIYPQAALRCESDAVKQLQSRIFFECLPYLFEELADEVDRRFAQIESKLDKRSSDHQAGLANKQGHGRGAGFSSRGTSSRGRGGRGSSRGTSSSRSHDEERDAKIRNVDKAPDSPGSS